MYFSAVTPFSSQRAIFEARDKANRLSLNKFYAGVAPRAARLLPAFKAMPDNKGADAFFEATRSAAGFPVAYFNAARKRVQSFTQAAGLYPDFKKGTVEILLELTNGERIPIGADSPALEDAEPKVFSAMLDSIQENIKRLEAGAEDKQLLARVMCRGML